MPIEIVIALALFALLIIGSLCYVVIRMWREPPPQGISPASQRLARLVGFPKLFDGLVSKPLTRREKLGWFAFFVIAVIAVLLTGKN